MSTPPPAAAGDAVPNLSISVAGKIMMSGVVIFFFLFVFLLILFLRANRYMGASPALASTPARFVLPVSGAAFPRRTLDLAVLRSLPVTIFSSVAFKDGMECSVCLTELADGDATRFLPGCRHGFHLECIDMWFGSNSTCPICRSSVELPAAESKNMILVDSEQSSTINNRALGDETVIPADGSGEGSSSSICSVSRKGNGIMAIDIPRIGLESSAFALHSSRILAAVEVKSPNLASLRSLRRVLSMGSRGFGSACSSRGWDAEQGIGSDGGEGCSSNKNCQRDLNLVEEAFFVKDGKRIAMR